MLNERPLGVVGLNPRAVANSAKRLGFKVYLVDYFADVDTLKVADHVFSLQRDLLNPDMSDYSMNKLVDLTIEKLDGIVGSLLITSGLGCNPDMVRKLEKHFDILGNNSKKIRRSKDWKNLKGVLENLSVSYPKTKIVNSFKDFVRVAYVLKYPFVLKSFIKGIGIYPVVIHNENELETFKDFEFKDNYFIAQEYIRGMPISSSILCDGYEAFTISVNRQLIGVKEFYAEKDLTYCGYVLPLDKGKEEISYIKRISNKIVSELGLVGSNGVDYVISEDNRVYFMEVNTRFQDTLESVEKYLGINLVEEHLNALKGKIKVKGLKDSSSFSFGKGILFADRLTRIKDFTLIGGIADIPHQGAIIQKGDPVCGFFSKGRSNEETLRKLIEKANFIRKNYLLRFLENSSLFLEKK